MLSPSIVYTPRLTDGQRQLLALPGRLRNLAPLMTQSIAPAAVEMLRRHWDTKGAAFGHPWAAWAPSTLAARTRKGNVAQGILRDTNALFETLLASIADARRLARVAGGVRLELGPNAIDDPIERAKAIFHQGGTERHGVPFMPARQVVPSPLPRSFRDLVRSLTLDFVATGRVRGASGRFVSAETSR